MVSLSSAMRFSNRSVANEDGLARLDRQWPARADRGD
jgi:hypothetical protein